MKSLLTILKWALAIGVVLFLFGPATQKAFTENAAVRDLVVHAKSIRLEHFHPAFDGSGEVLIAARDLLPGDFYHVSDACPPFLDASIPGFMTRCLFDPHHRIIITDAAGHTTVISVCFECDHVQIARKGEAQGDLFASPFVWSSALRHFFANEGMPNSPSLYRPARVQSPESPPESATGN